MTIRLGPATAIALGLALATACGDGGGEPAESAPTPPAEDEADVSGTPAPSGGETPEVTEETAAAEAPNPFAGFPEPYATADYDRGRRIFLQCQSCHTLDEGGPAVLGPNLYGLFSRKVGESEGFDYSPALQEADFEWTSELLEQWLQNPRSFLPGNRMSFAGVQRPDDRTAVIAYIMAGTGYEPS